MRRHRASSVDAVGDGVVLLFPPLWVAVDMPYLSLPMLGAFLEAHGIGTQFLDLNVLCLRLLGDASAYTAVRAKENASVFREAANGIVVAARRMGAPAISDRHRAAMFVAGVRGTSTTLAELIEKATSKKPGPLASFIRQFITQAVGTRSCTVAGITVTTESQIFFALLVARYLREIHPSIRIVLGGAWCTLMAPVLIRRPEFFSIVDAVVVGEGERALLGYFKAAVSNEPLHGVPSLLYLHGGRVVSSTRSILNSIADLPFPCFDRLDLHAYNADGQRANLPIQASRGCYHGRCRFCNYVVLHPRYRSRPASCVLAEMAHLVSTFRPRNVVLVDDVVAPDFLEELAELILQMGLAVRWTAISRISERFTSRVLTLLRRAGCWKLFFGAESASQPSLDRIGKGILVSSMSRVVKAAHDAGITVALSFMLGLPGETVEDIRHTMEFAGGLPVEKNNLSILEFLIARGSYYWNHLNHIVNDTGYCEMLSRNDVLLNFRMPRPIEVQKEIAKWAS